MKYAPQSRTLVISFVKSAITSWLRKQDFFEVFIDLP